MFDPHVKFDKLSPAADADKPARRLKSGSLTGLSRASKVTPFDSLHMISYYRPIVTLCLECTVFKILRHNGRKPPKHTLPSFDAPSPENPLEYPHKPYTARNGDIWPAFLPLIVSMSMFIHIFVVGSERHV